MNDISTNHSPTDNKPFSYFGQFFAQNMGWILDLIFYLGFVILFGIFFTILGPSS